MWKIFSEDSEAFSSLQSTIYACYLYIINQQIVHCKLFIATLDTEYNVDRHQYKSQVYLSGLKGYNP